MYDADHLDHVKFVFIWRSPGPEANRPWTWAAGTEGIELVLHGRGVFNYQSEDQPVYRGHMIWHQPGDQTLYRVEATNPYHTLVLMFATAREARVRPPRLTLWVDPDEAQTFASEVQTAYHGGGYDHRYLCHHLYSRLWWQVHRAHLAGNQPSEPTPMVAALKAIREHYMRPLRVRDLADAAGLSVTHLHRLFVEHHQITPLQALIRQRIVIAKTLLAHDPHISAREVAGQCGFKDPVHFGRIFKREVGCTPLAYRSRHAYPRIVGHS